MSTGAPLGDPIARFVDDVAMGRRRAWIIEGVPGGGSTRFVERATHLLRGRGFDTVLTTAMPALRDLPLGALFPLVALDASAAPDDTPAQRLQRVTERLAGTAKTTIVVIDDIAWLDDVSAAVLHQLVRSYGVRLVGTARIGHPLPAPLVRLDDEGLLTRVSVPALGDDEAVAHVERVAGGRVSPPSLVALIERAGTHPLFLRLLVEQSVRSGLARTTPLGLDLGTPAPSARLRTLVQEWVALTDGAHLDTLRLLAMALRLPRAVLDETDVAALVEAGLAVGSPETVRIVTPLVGEIVTATLDNARRREVAQRVAHLLADEDDVTSRITRTALLCAAGDPPPTADVAWAARMCTALGQHGTAVDLGDRALALAIERAEPVPADAVLLRGESLWLLGRHAEADAAMNLALEVAVDDASLALAASRAGSYWSMRRENPAYAYRVTDEVRERLDDPQARAFLETSTPKWRIMLGDLPPSLPSGGRLGAGGASSAVAALDPMLSTALASCLGGDTVRARAAITAGRPHAEAAVAFIRHGVELFDYAEAVVECAEGDLPTALATFRRRARHRLSEAVGVWTHAEASCEFLNGNVDGALLRAREATHQLAWRDVLAFEGQAIGNRATIAAWLGRTAEAEECLERLTPGMRALVITDLAAAQAESWLAFRAGDLSAATAVERAVEAAEGRHHDWWLALAAHSAIRMGHPAVVCTVLRRLDPRHQGPTVRLILAHGEALEQGDPAALVTAAQGLEAAGYLGGAYDAARQALALGAHPDAAAASRRARVVATRIGGLLSPSPTTRSTLADLLTAREWAVASAASTRARNREIAESLGLSHRTVENHLAAVYRKLGVSGRDELREIIAADATA